MGGLILLAPLSSLDYMAFVYLLKSIKQYINGHATNQIFSAYPNFIRCSHRSTLKKSEIV